MGIPKICALKNSLFTTALRKTKKTEVKIESNQKTSDVTLKLVNFNINQHVSFSVHLLDMITKAATP